MKEEREEGEHRVSRRKDGERREEGEKKRDREHDDKDRHRDRDDRCCCPPFPPQISGWTRASTPNTAKRGLELSCQTLQTKSDTAVSM